MVLVTGIESVRKSLRRFYFGAAWKSPLQKPNESVLTQKKYLSSAGSPKVCNFGDFFSLSSICRTKKTGHRLPHLQEEEKKKKKRVFKMSIVYGPDMAGKSVLYESFANKLSQSCDKIRVQVCVSLCGRLLPHFIY